MNNVEAKNLTEAKKFYLKNLEIRKNAEARGEKPLSYFNQKDLTMMKNFLIYANVFNKDELLDFGMGRLKLFLKMNEACDYVYNSVSHKNTKYYNIPYILTDGKCYSYREIKKKSWISQKAIQTIKQASNQAVTKVEPVKKHPLVYLSYIDTSGIEHYSFGKETTNGFVIGTYDKVSKTFKETKRFRNANCQVLYSIK